MCFQDGLPSGNKKYNEYNIVCTPNLIKCALNAPPPR